MYGSEQLFRSQPQEVRANRWVCSARSRSRSSSSNRVVNPQMGTRRWTGWKSCCLWSSRPCPSWPHHPKLEPPKPPPKPAKPAKSMKMGKKVGVDPTDFLALRAELIDMKARLDESEQARAIVEARLSSLDAAASQYTTERNEISEVASMVIQLQQQVAELPVDSGSSGGSSSNESATDELSAKVDALQNRFFGLQDHTPKIVEFETQIAQLRAELESANAAAAEAAALLPLATTSGPDPETLERIAAVQLRVNDLDQIRHRLGEIDHFKQRMGEIDALQERVAGVEALQERVAGVEAIHERVGELDNVDQRLANVDGLAMQLAQLNARVAAQAELGGQVSALRDRVEKIGDQPRGADDDIRLQLQEIGERLQRQRRDTSTGRDVARSARRPATPRLAQSASTWRCSTSG